VEKAVKTAAKTATAEPPPRPPLPLREEEDSVGPWALDSDVQCKGGFKYLIK
jgi:hypothetical protein